VQSASDAIQDQRIEECFNHEIERKCSTCPAYHNRGGHCCFGRPDRFNDEDEECINCDFFAECQVEVTDLAAEEQYQRRVFSSPYGTTGVRRSPTVVIPRAQPQPRLVQIGDLRHAQPPPVARPQVKREEIITPQAARMELAKAGPEESLFMTFIKTAAWGAFQGAAEMAAHFFRTNWWPTKKQ
jgi:hypothetical protein